MKLTTRQILHICIATISAIVIPQLAIAQMPPDLDSTTVPTVPKQIPPAVDSTTTPPIVPTQIPGGNIVVAPRLKVSCQDLKTVVEREDRRAVMMTWTTNYFGEKFSNAKRCQIVSERLQKASDLNGGTFKELELASGTLNSQTVICVLKDNSQKCDQSNLLLTLKPENARDPQAVIRKIATFANNGTGVLDENNSPVDLNLGHWELKTFGVRKTTSVRKTPGIRKAPTRSKPSTTGF
jgi:Circadian oscillating protein COP23